MGLGFDSDSFLATHIKPLIQDVGLSKTLTFSSLTRSTAAGGGQTVTKTESSTTGIVISTPKMSQSQLMAVFPDGEISKEFVKIFYVESELSFTPKQGDELKIYKGATLLGTYTLKYLPRNMVVTDVVMGFAVSGR